MKYLVDTHYLIWSLLDPQKIDKRKIEILEDPDSIKFISKISFWEISLKYSIGKLELEGVSPEEMVNASLGAGYQIFDITAEEFSSSHKLPFIDNHKDPFDRLIIWQCIKNDLILITADSKIKEYKKFGLKIFE